jgi:hypothetical protein
MKRIAIHQPNFLPWGGYFEKMRDADFFVILDDVQYSSGGYTNRAQFGNDKVENSWFTIPVKKKYGQLICDVEISDWKLIKRKLENAIKLMYPITYFEFEDVFEKEYVKLADLNIDLIFRIRKIMGIDTPIVYSSELRKYGAKSDLILDIVKTLGGNAYLSGGLKNKYLNLESFKESGIEVVFTDYSQQFDSKTQLYNLEKRHDTRTKSENINTFSTY